MGTKKMGSGWLTISTPEDLTKAITRMLNKILMCEDPVAHAGRFASLANAWTNAYRLFLEEEEIVAIKERLDVLEQNKNNNNINNNIGVIQIEESE
jgi:hypothetical protein